MDAKCCQLSTVAGHEAARLRHSDRPSQPAVRYEMDQAKPPCRMFHDDKSRSRQEEDHLERASRLIAASLNPSARGSRSKKFHITTTFIHQHPLQAR